MRCEVLRARKGLLPAKFINCWLGTCCPTTTPNPTLCRPAVFGPIYHMSFFTRASSNKGCCWLAGGQFFNLFNLGKNDMKTLKTKELKNGRLAMVSPLVSLQALGLSCAMRNPPRNGKLHVDVKAGDAECAVAACLLNVQIICSWPSLAMALRRSSQARDRGRTSQTTWPNPPLTTFSQTSPTQRFRSFSSGGPLVKQLGVDSASVKEQGAPCCREPQAIHKHRTGL